MIKKNIVTALMISALSLGVLTGCDTKESATPEPIENTNVSVATEVADNHRVFFETYISNPREAFPGAEFTIINSDSDKDDGYAFWVEGVTQEDFYNYIDSIDKDVFYNITMYDSSYFDATTGVAFKEDVYALTVFYSDYDSTLDVYCNYIEANNQ